MLHSRIEGGGESGREQFISQFKHCGQAADKNKQTKRKVGHTKQTKKEIISKQMKAKKIEQTTIIMRTEAHHMS